MKSELCRPLKRGEPAEKGFLYMKKSIDKRVSMVYNKTPYVVICPSEAYYPW